MFTKFFLYLLSTFIVLEDQGGTGDNSDDDSSDDSSDDSNTGPGEGSDTGDDTLKWLDEETLKIIKKEGLSSYISRTIEEKEKLKKQKEEKEKEEQERLSKLSEAEREKEEMMNKINNFEKELFERDKKSLIASSGLPDSIGKYITGNSIEEVNKNIQEAQEDFKDIIKSTKSENMKPIQKQGFRSFLK